MIVLLLFLFFVHAIITVDYDLVVVPTIKATKKKLKVIWKQFEKLQKVLEIIENDFQRKPNLMKGNLNRSTKFIVS